MKYRYMSDVQFKNQTDLLSICGFEFVYPIFNVYLIIR
ncbi:hypothetical protein M2263_001587 [Providencia alcalifaciens]|nr:hypothetical protein [Providencia alcalifaciens]